MTDLAAIKAKLLENQAKKSGEGRTQSSGGDNASYPFWNIPDNSQATIRFLPDGDPDNVFFWVKREIIKMPFQGVVGGEYPTDREVTVQVPCVDMFGMSCPVTAAIRPWWKGSEEEKALARVYYKKKSFIYQGFVVGQSPFQEASVPENPIRRFVLNPSIHEIVEQSLMDPQMEDAPTDYVRGCDFIIKKTKKGQYANYSTSQWARKERSLGESELVAIDQHGLFNLKDYLGRVPDSDEVAAIKAMFDDSLAGKPFDAASYGKYYRAFGGGSRSESTPEAVPSTPRSYAEPETTREAEVSAPAAAPSSSAKSAQDILDRIRQRNSQ